MGWSILANKEILMPTQEIIEKAIIGKRVVAIAWVPVLDKDEFAVSSITLEGGITLKFQGRDGDAVFANLIYPNLETYTKEVLQEILDEIKEIDHADA
jgi:hypothetical protein